MSGLLKGGICIWACLGRPLSLDYIEQITDGDSAAPDSLGWCSQLHFRHCWIGTDGKQRFAYYPLVFSSSEPVPLLPEASGPKTHLYAQQLEPEVPIQSRVYCLPARQYYRGAGLFSSSSLPSHASWIGTSGILASVTVVLFNFTTVIGCGIMGYMTDQ